MVLLIKAVGMSMSKEEVQPAKESHGVPSQGVGALQLVRPSLARLLIAPRSPARAASLSRRQLRRLRQSTVGSPSALVTSTAVESSSETQHVQRPLELGLNQPHLTTAMGGRRSRLRSFLAHPSSWVPANGINGAGRRR
jgi:hypothetical protein